MDIKTLTVTKLDNSLGLIPFTDLDAIPSKAQQPSKNRASWRKFLAESSGASLNTKSDLLDKLEGQFQTAFNDKKFEKALGLIDQMIEITDQNNQGRAEDSQVFNFSKKSLCLRNLGKFEEAYIYSNKALLELSSYGDKLREEEAERAKNELIELYQNNASIFGEYNSDDVWHEVVELMPYLFTTINERIGAEENSILNDLGFLALAMDKTELAIDHFRKAALCKGDFEDIDHDEFFYRILEKKLGDPIIPAKNHLNVIANLSRKSSLTDQEYYQLMISSALVGNHDEALKAYDKIERKGEFPDEVPFFLAYLRNDLETARNELKNVSNKYCEYMINL